MVRFVDTHERQEELLGLVIDSYIKESKPISSSYLCEKYNLQYSPATVRNALLSLEQQGLLSHIHTSSGRVPTKDGFKRYVGHLKAEDIAKDTMAGLQVYEEHSLNLNKVIDRTLEALTRFSGYTSLVAISGQDEKLFYKGMRFILEQPEFEDIACLRDIFNTLEVHMDELHDILLNSLGSLDEKIQILIGDDIGFSEIANCSLIVRGVREEPLRVALAILGPMRMDYLRAASCLYSVRNQLKSVVEELI